MPVVVVTTHELEEYVRRMLESPADESRGYSQAYDYKKTDLAYPGTGAVVASKAVLPGDVLAIGGWALRETTGAAVATVRLRDGSAAINEVIAPITIAAGGFVFFPPYGRGIEVATGKVFLEVVAGSLEGVIYWR
jgi:hypothetical protein